MINGWRRPLFGIGGALCLIASSLYAVTYTEVGDAGQTIGTAQATAATQAASGQPLSAIFGSLSAGTDVDIFLINIIDPANFSASTVNALTTGAGLDTELFLFNSSGRPVYANDDEASGMFFQSTLPAGDALRPTVAGLYYLAISLTNNEPVNLANQFLFAVTALSTDTRGPNPSATGPLAMFDPSGVNSGATGGSYRIDLTGATTAVPEPSATALYIAGAAILGLIALKQRKGASLT